MTRNSGVLRGVILAVLTSMITLMGGLMNPTSAADPPLPAPTVSDLCGTSKDRVYPANDADPTTDVSWVDSSGVYYAAGEWNSSNKASSLTLTVNIWGASGLTTYTYPPVNFGVEPDASCVQALDTVTVSEDMSCMANGGTRATFTYMNTPDIGWPQTLVSLFADRWDHGQSASFNFTTEGEEVPEGGTVSLTGGDSYAIKTDKDFFLAPGTYSMWVRTAESGQRKLPNTFFVPACGDRKVPSGDPSGLGGPSGTSKQPRGFLKQVSPTKVKVKAINKGVARKTAFKVVIDPVKGKTVIKSFKVAAGKSPAPRYYKASPRAKVLLKARVLVEDANGRLVKQWKVLKRLKLKAG
jgi:hypothetical protein